MLVNNILGSLKSFANDSIQPLFEKLKNDVVSSFRIEAGKIGENIKNEIALKFSSSEGDIQNLLQKNLELEKMATDMQAKIILLQDCLEDLKNSLKEPLPRRNEVQQACKLQNLIYYAKMVDSSNPLGFKMANLSYSMEGCAFKITMKSPTLGEYGIVDDSEIRQEILAAFDPLIIDSSDYDNVPQTLNKITIVQKGIVVKENDVLVIKNKQKVKFD